MGYLHGLCCHGTQFNRSVNRLGMFKPWLVRGTCFAGIPEDSRCSWLSRHWLGSILAHAFHWPSMKWLAYHTHLKRRRVWAWLGWLLVLESRSTCRTIWPSALLLPMPWNWTGALAVGSRRLPDVSHISGLSPGLRLVQPRTPTYRFFLFCCPVFTWRRKQNPVSETSKVYNFIIQTIDSVQKYNLTYYELSWLTSATRWTKQKKASVLVYSIRVK
jgi:hypothetical protein